MDDFGFGLGKEGLGCLFGFFFPVFILSCLSFTALFLFVHDLNIMVFLTFFSGPSSVCFCVLDKQQVMVKKNILLLLFLSF